MKNMNVRIVAILVLFGLLGVLPSHAQLLENQLKNHPAPYLALHGDDPVAWKKWNIDAMEKAKADNKIVFLSVGYFACHWCHVMQQESYQDESVAEILNDHFVSVKIDRELEPALDSQLMDFAQRTVGRGGWPLNVFVTPEGYPIYSLLYASRDQFETMLTRLQDMWEKDPDAIRKLVEVEARSGFTAAGSDIDRAQMQDAIDSAAQKMMARADIFEGGFGEQNKFPSTAQLTFLLSRYQRTSDKEEQKSIKDFLELTLDSMGTQGLHDHLSGGFFRYTVDPSWGIPHFEKMLYDNANLASLYVEAGEVFARPDYALLAKRTLDFMQDRMWLDGAFVASFSAVDDDSIEGGHYLWHREQLQQILSEQEFALVGTVWGLDRPAELDAGNHVRWHSTLAAYAKQNNQSIVEVEALLVSAGAKMLRIRTTRSLPVDDKLLAGWNGLALSAFARAAEAYGDERYRQTAKALAVFIAKELWDGEKLSRARVKGEIFGTASLEDYAYIARGLVDWGRVSSDKDSFELAETLLRLGWQKFYQNLTWQRQDGGLLAPPAGSEVMEDGSLASPAAILIAASAVIAEQAEDEDWMQTIRSAVNRGQSQFNQAPYWYASQMQALQLVLDAYGKG